MTIPETDSEFEAFLKTRTVLPNGMSDDDKLEPPKALDAIVLKKAREAIRARERVSRPARWATPVALAATILLCLSIVLNVSLNTNRPAASLQRMTAATADKPSPTPAGPASEDERREKVADGTVSSEAILPEEKVAGSRAPRPSVLAEAAPPARAPAELPRADGSAARKAEALASRSDSPTQGLSEVTTTSRRRAAGPAPTGAPTIANSAANQPAQLANRGRAQEPAPSEVPGGGADSATDSVTTLGTRSYAEISLPRAATRQTPAAAPSPSAAAPATPSPSTGMASSAAVPATGPPDSVATAPEGEQPALAKRKAAASPHPQDPQTWLRQIAALRAEGKAAQAEAEMRRFRSIFPAYPAKPGPSAPSEPPK